MLYSYLLSLTLLLLPAAALAQGPNLQSLLGNVIIFLSVVFIPFLFGIAFLFFVYNVIRYFVIEGASEEGREKAKNLALYSIAAFVFLVMFWGIVNMLTDSLGLEDGTQPCPDIIKQFNPDKCPK